MPLLSDYLCVAALRLLVNLAVPAGSDAVAAVAAVAALQVKTDASWTFVRRCNSTKLLGTDDDSRSLKSIVGSGGGLRLCVCVCACGGKSPKVLGVVPFFGYGLCLCALQGWCFA